MATEITEQKGRTVQVVCSIIVALCAIGSFYFTYQRFKKGKL